MTLLAYSKIIIFAYLNYRIHHVIILDAINSDTDIFICIV